MTVFVSLDVETTGPCPAVADLCSIGAVAFREDDLSYVGGEFYVRLMPPFPGSGWRWNEDTRLWWEEQNEEAKREALSLTLFRYTPQSAACQLEAWLSTLEDKPAFVAHPGNFDWQWINDLQWRHLGRNAFGYRAVCIRTGGWVYGGCKEWGEDRMDDPDFHVQPEVPHHPLHDAKAQAESARKLIAAARARA